MAQEAASAEPAEDSEEVEVKGDVSDQSELEGLLERLVADSVSVEVRQAAARDIIALGPSAAPALQGKLKELRRASTGGVLAVFNILRDQVRGGINGDSFDLVDALCKFPKTDGPGFKASLPIAVIVRALAHVGDVPSVKAIVRFTDAHDGAFRIDIARVLKKLGEPAIPGLLESKRGSVEVRKFVNRQLESMGKRNTGDMVQVKSAVVQGDVLRAFGHNRDIDALNVVLSFVNSERALVRQSAREALAMYGQNGKWKLKEAYANLTGQSAQEGWSAEEIARELFAAYDQVRIEEAMQILDGALNTAKTGKREQAIADFERAMAMQPLLERRGEMVPVYTEHAQSLVESEPDKALALYKRALRIETDPERRAKTEAMMYYLEGKMLQKQGIADLEPFRRASQLDPSLVEAKDEERRLTEAHESRRDVVRRYAAGIAILLVAIAGILLFPRRKARAPAEA